MLLYAADTIIVKISTVRMVPLFAMAVIFPVFFSCFITVYTAGLAFVRNERKRNKSY